METTETELMQAQVRLKKDGTLVQRVDGSEVVVARYDRTTGFLEFETREHSVKLYNQVTARIGTINKGTEQSGFVIKRIGIKGESTAPAANIPKRPKMGPLGDATPEVVEWYFEHNLPEAIIRYGVYTDTKGRPVKRDVRRIVESMTDRRDEADDALPWVKTGNKTQDKTPVGIEREVVSQKNAIIARRATCMTFVPQEVVGGFELDDDGNADLDGEEGDE